jgi:hypothetical protein
MATRWLAALILGIVLVPPIEAAKWQGGCPLVKTGRSWDDPLSQCVLRRVGKGYTQQYLFKDQQRLSPGTAPCCARSTTRSSSS